MAALDFPINPTLNERYPATPVPGIATYTWDGEKWIVINGDAGGGGDVITGPVTGDASDIAFTPTGTIEATNVQDAIVEVSVEGGTSGDYLPLTGGTVTGTLVVNEDLSVVGNISAGNGIDAPFITANSKLEVYGGTFLIGNTSINGNIDVTGNGSFDKVTLTGELTIAAPAFNSNIIMNAPDSTHSNFIYGKRAGLELWRIVPGASTTGDFTVMQFDDAGNWVVGQQPLTIAHTTGLITVKADPTAALGVATKQYVDAHAGGGGGITEAPVDGHQYARQNLQWTEITIATSAEYIGNSVPTKMLTSGAVWGAAASVEQLTVLAEVTPAFSDATDFQLTLTNATAIINNPISIKVGQKGYFYIVQDATGNRTIDTWGTYYKFPGGTAPVLSTAADAIDVVSYSVKSLTEVMCTFDKGFETTPQSVSNAPAWVPAGAEIHLDFSNKRAWDGTTELDVDGMSALLGNDVTGTAENWYFTSGYDPATMYTDDGLTTSSMAPVLLGVLRDKVLAGSTCIIRTLYCNNNGWNPGLYFFSEEIPPGTDPTQLFSQTSADIVEAHTEAGPFYIECLNAFNNGSPTVVKYSATAHTYTSDASKRVEIGGNAQPGVAANWTDTDIPNLPTIVMLTGGFIESFTVYPPQPVSALAGLTVIPTVHPLGFDAGAVSIKNLNGYTIGRSATGVGAGQGGRPYTTVGKFYFEIRSDVSVTDGNAVGVMRPFGLAPFTDPTDTLSGATGLITNSTANKIYNDGVLAVTFDDASAVGKTYALAIDFTARLLWIRNDVNTKWNNNASADPATGVGGVSIVSGALTQFVRFGNGLITDVWKANFGLRDPYVMTPPAGFGMWTDVPELMSTTAASLDQATAATCAVWNYISVYNSGGSTTNAGCKVTLTSGKTTGKYYYEVAWSSIKNAVPANLSIGVCITTQTYANLGTNGTGGVIAKKDGVIYANGTNTGILAGGAFFQQCLSSVAVDLDNRKIWFRNTGTSNWNNNAANDPATNVGGIDIPAGTIVPCATFGATGNVGNNAFCFNFGQTPMKHTTPAGFTTGWPI